MGAGRVGPIKPRIKCCGNFSEQIRAMRQRIGDVCFKMILNPLILNCLRWVVANTAFWPALIFALPILGLFSSSINKSKEDSMEFEVSANL